MNARLRDTKRMLVALAAEHGAMVKLATTRRGHVRATFVISGVPKADTIIGMTPGDWRNRYNNAALVRRLLRVTANARAA
jgi:hypothetical protein